MEFGQIYGGDIDDVVTTGKKAESLGFDRFGLGDSQLLSQEMYTTLGVLARETETIQIGPSVTNPVTRHPAIHASAMANIEEISDGRAFLGISSGDSAVYTLGKRPAKIAQLEEAITLIKSLTAGAEVEYNDEPLQLHWLDDDRDYDVPVGPSAEGPKTLEMAGRSADHVIIGLGKTPSVIETAVNHVNKGARAADRDPDEIEKWLFVDANVRDSREEAIDEMKHSLASSAHHSLQFSMEGKAVPDRLQDDLQTLVDNYNSHEHGQPDKDTNRNLVETLELTEYLAERYAVTGTPEDCIEQLRAIDETGLIDGVIFAVHTGRGRQVMTRFGEEILPNV